MIKPFNLHLALTGTHVQTRAGQKVKVWRCPSPKETYVLEGVIAGDQDFHYWTVTGKYFDSDTLNTPHDLVLYYPHADTRRRYTPTEIHHLFHTHHQHPEWSIRQLATYCHMSKSIVAEYLQKYRTTK
jgi:hypothetical protein